jgi:hypothetical protein
MHHRPRIAVGIGARIDSHHAQVFGFDLRMKVHVALGDHGQHGRWREQAERMDEVAMRAPLAEAPEAAQLIGAHRPFQLSG